MRSSAAPGAFDRLLDLSLDDDQAADLKHGRWFARISIEVPASFERVEELVFNLERRMWGRLPSVTCFEDRILDVFFDVESANDETRKKVETLAGQVLEVVGAGRASVRVCAIGIIDDPAGLLDGDHAPLAYDEIKHL
jgi:hypothetical protein